MVNLLRHLRRFTSGLLRFIMVKQARRCPRSGHPIEVTTPEMVTKIHDIVLGDRRVKLKEVANTVNISYKRVSSILHEHLHAKKLLARWASR